MAKRLLSIILIIVLASQMIACDFKGSVNTASEKVKSTTDAATESLQEMGENVSDTAINAKNAVVEWYCNIDKEKFEKGWNHATELIGASYEATVDSVYMQNVNNAIENLGEDINQAYGSSRSKAQEAGFAAEKWAADTFNINAIANGSEERASTVGSNSLGSVDVETTYGENASLKYYKTASESATAQAKALIKAYNRYANEQKSQGKEVISLDEYMDKNGFSSIDSVYDSLYEGQTRIIPADQIVEATEYLEGRIDKLSSIEGKATEETALTYAETLSKLSDRLKAQDGTESIPLTYEEAQAIGELAKEGKFKPEDFGVTLSNVVPAKYVLKQSMSAGVEAAALRTIFTIGPDVYEIIRDAAIQGNISEQDLEKVGIEGVIAASEGFVEGSLSKYIAIKCAKGDFGKALKGCSPEIVATLVVLTIEAAINGYALAKGEISLEDYGNMMAEESMIAIIAIPTTSLVMALPIIGKIPLVGCAAGGILAAFGYAYAKESVLKIQAAGGFEAILPEGMTNGINVGKELISGISMKSESTDSKLYDVSTNLEGDIVVSKTDS